MITDEQRTHTYKGYTLIDITNTGITKFSIEAEQARNQQRNWETVVQILGMRTQLFRVEQTGVRSQDVSTYKFGNAYKGKHQIWSFEFDVEFQNAVPSADFDQVPVITGLTDTANPTTPLFYTTGINKNIYFDLV
jgi:hypothetical protein